jgi:uncharacterized protein (TIRG00374 family)
MIPPFVKHLLKFLLGGVAIWLLIRSGTLDPRLVGKAMENHPWICLAALGCYIVLVVVAAWGRWFVLLRYAGLKVKAGRVFSLHMVGIFFNSLIPGGTGGDLVKGYYLFQEHGEEDRGQALVTIAVDRFVGLYGLLCMAMFMAAWNWDLWKDTPPLRVNGIFYGGVFLGFTLLIALFFSPFAKFFLEHETWHNKPGGRFLKVISDGLAVYRRRPMGLLYALALGVMVDFGLVLLYYMSAESLEVYLPFRVHGFVVPTLTMINGIPISPAGLGVGEAAGEWLYAHLGIKDGGGEVLALVHICILIASLAGAPFYFFFRPRKPKK